MKKSHFAFKGIVLISALAGLALSPMIASAQEDEPGRIQVRLVNVKSGGAAGWESAIGDAAGVLQAAGMPFLHVYQRIRGDTPGYTIITADGAYTDLPPVELDSGVIDRLQNNGNGSTVVSLAVLAELGIDSGSLEPSAPFLYVRVRTVAPGNADAYIAWHRDELTPALREAGLPDLRTGRVTIGGNTNTFVRYAFTDDVTGGVNGLDIPGTVGQREFDRIIAREAELLSTSEDYVYRFREDLSFTAE